MTFAQIGVENKIWEDAELNEEQLWEGEVWESQDNTCCPENMLSWFTDARTVCNTHGGARVNVEATAL